VREVPSIAGFIQPIFGQMAKRMMRVRVFALIPKEVEGGDAPLNIAWTLCWLDRVGLGEFLGLKNPLNFLSLVIDLTPVLPTLTFSINSIFFLIIIASTGSTWHASTASTPLPNDAVPFLAVVPTGRRTIMRCTAFCLITYHIP
jgi:hypothetical protein